MKLLTVTAVLIGAASFAAPSLAQQQPATSSRLAPEAAQPGPKQHFVKRWWRYRRVHRLFGFKFWSFVVGAAPLDDALEAFWGELGFAVIQGYGLTETAPIVTLNHPFGTHARRPRVSQDRSRTVG